MAALATYLGAKWLLVIAAVLAIAIVGVCAFVLKNWKLAVATVALVILGLLYQSAVTDGIKIQMAKDAQEKLKAKDSEIAILNGRLATMNTLAIHDAIQAADDAKYISALEEKANATPPNSSPALSRDAAGRVREIK